MTRRARFGELFEASHAVDNITPPRELIEQILSTPGHQSAAENGLYRSGEANEAVECVC